MYVGWTHRFWQDQPTISSIKGCPNFTTTADVEENKDVASCILTCLILCFYEISCHQRWHMHPQPNMHVYGRVGRNLVIPPCVASRKGRWLSSWSLYEDDLILFLQGCLYQPLSTLLIISVNFQACIIAGTSQCFTWLTSFRWQSDWVFFPNLSPCR